MRLTVSAARPSTGLRSLALTFALGAALVGCGTEASSPSTVDAGPQACEPTEVEVPSEMPTDLTGSCVEVRASPSMVIDLGDGPELCLGAVAMSLPPGCGGPALLGWDWKNLPHGVTSETADGVTWTEGGLLVAGHYDGETFGLTSVSTYEDPDERVWPESAGSAGGSEPDDDAFGTPCAEPSGGWRAHDSTRLDDQDDWWRAVGAAERVEGFVGSWTDTPKSLRRTGLAILNVSTIGDVDATEAAIRENWGGPYCISVSRSKYSAAHLNAAQQRLSDVVGMTSAGVDIDAGRVDLQVEFDDGRIQAWSDAEFGEGAVLVRSAVEPVPEA